MKRLDYTPKPVKGLKDWIKKQYNTHFIYYRRTGSYAECMCAECGAKYLLRTKSTKDPFKDAAIDIEMPVRDEKTHCRKCKTKATYKPAGKCKSEIHYQYAVTGEKISDTKFLFVVYDTWQKTIANKVSLYGHCKYSLIILEKGKKHEAYYHHGIYGWVSGGRKPQSRYAVHPRTYTEIKKTKMFKYVPVPEDIRKAYIGESWVIDFYAAAARYPDMEMLIKLGAKDYYKRFVFGETTNLNPRGKTIENRLRIRKDRLKDFVEDKGDYKKLRIYQMERAGGTKWTDEEIKIVESLQGEFYLTTWATALKYTSPTRLKNYLTKMKMWPISKKYETRRKQREKLIIYFDYVDMKASLGYDMNDINLFPRDIRRRHDETVIEKEAAAIEKRKMEVLNRFPNIRKKYKKLADKYSAAAGGLIIRPAKDAAEIVTEGRVLHHCVGGDSYLTKHNSGKSSILFLRKAAEKDTPYITIEIHNEEIVQWYGAYDKKPDKTMIDAWLKTYTAELKKRKTKKKSCTGATRRTA